MVAPSILSADFACLKESIQKVQDAKWLHIDVMDGHFVPNITIGPVVIKKLRKHTKQVFDTHIMISNPEKYAEEFIKAGSDRLTFHLEATKNPLVLIKKIQSLNCKAGVSIKPNTPVETLLEVLDSVDQILVMSVEPGFGGQSFIPSALDKIKWLDDYRIKHDLHYTIVVDGGINDVTGAKCRKNGCDVLVAGSYIFNSDNPSERIEKLR